MSTIELVNITAVAALTIICVIGDIKTYKIRNSTVLFFLMLGILTNSTENGIDGIIRSLSGIAVPLILLFILYALGVIGAGDIKLFSAIGSLMGPWFIIRCMAYSFLAGGLIAIFVMIKRKNAGNRVRHFLEYVKTCYMSRCILEYSDFRDKTDGSKFRFSPAIAAATAFLLVDIYYSFL